MWKALSKPTHLNRGAADVSRNSGTTSRTNHLHQQDHLHHLARGCNLHQPDLLRLRQLHQHRNNMEPGMKIMMVLIIITMILVKVKERENRINKKEQQER